jgi:hypothetical protein
MRSSIVAASLLAAALALAGCSAGNAPPPIPAPIAEALPKPPVSPTALIWQPGHWDWNGSAYVWVPGQYVSPEGHGNNWLPAYWEKTDSGWIWHPAHWT